MDYTNAPLTAGDTEDWAALVGVMAEADGTQETYSAEDLAEELEDPGLEPADTVGYRGPDGQFVAFGQLWHRSALVDGAVLSYLFGGVHPAHRGRGIGTAIYDQLEDRIRDVAAARHPGIPAVARSDAESSVDSHRALLRKRGYAEARFFHVMRHDLGGVMRQDLGGQLIDVDPGLGIRAYHAADSDAVRQAHEAAFAQHWNSAPVTVEEWTSRFTGSRTFRPGSSFVRPGADGGLDAYVLTYAYKDGELWVGQLGVRSAARGQGIGRSLLAAVVQAAVVGGYSEVGLGVDTDNHTGAGRLYEAAGFQVVSTSVAHLKTL